MSQTATTYVVDPVHSNVEFVVRPQVHGAEPFAVELQFVEPALHARRLVQRRAGLDARHRRQIAGLAAEIGLDLRHEIGEAQ
ncbi:MAG TPA: hypothetical protein PLQ31_08755, partial [Thermoanaerobaculia bacterium]|nr:hypothetical protein [Thermoanaerobaculia bacterium]